MKTTIRRALVVLVLGIGFAGAHGAASSAVEVRFDGSQAEAALAILAKQAAGTRATDADWQRLSDSAGYQRLKAREAGMGRAFTDGEFKAFLSTPQTPVQIKALRKTLEDWSARSVDVPARAALAYLPAGTRLKATVFPMIKPKPNEFVYDLKADPAIFLYLDPGVSGAKAGNTMAHEMHHIGMGSACSRPSAGESGPASVVQLRKWMSAFGEGLAMLAAAGGPGVHPHAVSKAEQRDEWDGNIARFAEQLAEQDAFFLSVLDGTAGDDKTIDRRMMAYFGVQGPWYTVGWKMAVVIETQWGRQRTINAFCDAGQLLATYNEAARLQNRMGAAPLPLWDSRLAESLAKKRP